MPEITVYTRRDSIRVVAGEHAAHADSKSYTVRVYPNAQLAYAAETGPAIRAAIARIAPEAAQFIAPLPPIKKVSLRISDNLFRIGHPSYTGANAPAYSLRAADALLELIRRGVARPNAQQALADAARGSHVTVCADSGAVIEVRKE